MAERSRRFNERFALKILGCMFVVLFSLCCTACGFTVVYKITDYNSFLTGYEKYATVNYGFYGEIIDGFNPIINRTFDYGTAFSGDIAYVESNGESYILNAEGELNNTTVDVSGKTFVEGKYVFESGGKYGLLNAFGTVLLNADYDELHLSGNAVLGVTNNVTESYFAGFDSEYATMLGITQSNNAILLSDEYVVANGAIRDLAFNVCEIDGYRYTAIPKEGKVILTLQNGRFGYYDLNAKAFIGDSYASASSFCNGTAVVRNIDGRYAIINESGEEIYYSYDMQFGDCYDGYRVFYTNGAYGIMDDEFNIVLELQPHKILYDRAFSGQFIIQYESRCKIFSPQMGEYSVSYDDITYSGGLFFCADGNEVVVLDENLNELITCEYAEYSCGVLTVKYNGLYAYYARNIPAA